ncbi:zf-HC2 domain-containing protein [Actinoplanes sp. NPDC089786]|uniref:zf-HC2 domain-containing protein n=1 Tax=Actinoplanes sp. NPDC089786 TaxID=3155185 RepID=UPI003418FC37
MSPTCDDEAMRSLIGFLALDRLSAEERVAVTAHLESCASCRGERDEVDQVVSVLGMLSVADVSALLSEYAMPEAATPAPVTDQLFGAPGAPRPAPRAGDPADRPRVVPHVDRASRKRAQPLTIGEGTLRPRPATGPLARGPHTHRPARTRRRPTVVVGVLTAGVALALSTVLLLNPWTSSDRLGPVVAVAATKDGTSGVDISATLYAEEGGLSVRLAADGLGLGVYQLYAVTRDGEDLLLGRLTGAQGENSYAGDIPVPIDDLSSFSLRQVDGPLSVSVAVTREPAPENHGGR